MNFQRLRAHLANGHSTVLEALVRIVRELFEAAADHPRLARRVLCACVGGWLYVVRWVVSDVRWLNIVTRRDT